MEIGSKGTQPQDGKKLNVL